MCLITEANNTKVFELIKPYLSGMSLGEINRLIRKLNTCSYELFVEWVERSNNVKYKVLLKTGHVDLKEVMS